MRFALAKLVLAGMFVCAGCFTTTPPLTTTPAPKEHDAVKIAPPPVTPESVNDENYRARIQALMEELDRDEQQILLNKSPRE